MAERWRTSALRGAWAGALLCAVAVPLPAQRHKAPEGPRELVAFEGSLADARAAALERNLPVFLFLFLEGEAQNDEWQRQVFGSAELAAHSDEFLTLVGNDGQHARAPVEVGRDASGKPVTRELCGRYHTPTCKQHQELLDAAWLEFPIGGSLRLPQLIVLGPDGKLHQRIDTGNPIPPDRILRALDGAVAKFGPGLTIAELARVRAAQDRARAAGKEAHHGSAWKAWQEVLELTSAERYAAPAREGQAAALAAMAEQTHELDRMVAEQHVLEAYKKALGYRDDWADTPTAAGLAKWIRKLEKGKATRDAIEAYRRELEASARYDEAMELFRQGKESKGERILKLLLRKYADTPTGKRVAEEYPALVSG